MKRLLCALLLLAAAVVCKGEERAQALWCPDIHDGCQKLAVGKSDKGLSIFIPDAHLIHQTDPFWIRTVNGTERVILYEVDLRAERTTRVKPGLRRQLDFIYEYPYRINNGWRAGNERLSVRWNGGSAYLIWRVMDLVNDKPRPENGDHP